MPKLGPALEQIDGGWPTYRVEAEVYVRAGRQRYTITNQEILEREEAEGAARRYWQENYRRHYPKLSQVMVVEEGTGDVVMAVSKGGG